jgi:hypothetical protein
MNTAVLEGDEIIAPFASSPIDAMRGRGKLNATASAVASPTCHGSVPYELKTRTAGPKTKHSVSKRYKAPCSADGVISILILAEKASPIIGYKHGRFNAP